MNRTQRAARVKRDLAKLKPVFPECNEMVYSICSRPHETGATWTRLARETMGHTDTHRLKHSLKVRVTESRYNEVKELIEAEGKFPTVNAWLDWWVWVYIESHRRARKSAAAASELMSHSKAADEWRKHQARHLINCLVVVTEPETKTGVRAFFKIDAAANNYESVVAIVQHEDKYEALKKTALRELAAFRKKYDQIEELSSVFAAIDALSF